MHFYSLCGEILKQVDENPYLGLSLHETLNWSNHISKVAKKANSTMAFLRRNLRHCSEDCRKLGYISLVRSIMDYGAIIWDPFLQKDIDKLERVQRQAARFITGDYKSKFPGFMTETLEKLELPPLQDRRRSSRLIFLYKIIEGMVPAINPEEFITFTSKKRIIRSRKNPEYTTTNIIDKYTVNNDKGIQIKHLKSEQYRNSFFPKTSVDWNHLDTGTVHADTVEGFKAALPQYY